MSYQKPVFESPTTGCKVIDTPDKHYQVLYANGASRGYFMDKNYAIKVANILVPEDKPKPESKGKA